MTGPLLARTAAAATLGILTLMLGPASGARADVFGSISLLSASPFGQAEYAHDPALSEDGRYVVFDGSVAGVQGIWRRETKPGSTFEQVAGGEDATLPSISADGRYVSFTTNEGASLPAITDGRIHSGAPVREAPSVYVRDMEKHGVPNPETGEQQFESGAFTLVSAKDHSTQSLAYEFPGAGEEEIALDATRFGAVAAGRSAITADGRAVAFVTTAQSDLAGPGTPPLQVAVRHLDTDETELVSVRFDPVTGRPAIDPETGAPEPVPEEEGRYGAVWSPGVLPAFAPTPTDVRRPYLLSALPGAAISADGTAVAWYGGQISEQARTLSGERLEKLYAEPLWRRIANGPGEPARRVTGGSDPESPGCLAGPESQLPGKPAPGDPCQGPFATQVTGIGIWNNVQESDYIPRLSADGDYVAFLASAPLTSEVGAFGIGGSTYNSDVYREDMTAPDRTSGLIRLTQFASADTSRIPTNADISDLAISPDGQQIAFCTRRTVFPLGAPAFISPPSAVPGLVELYDADLANQTLTRVTRGYQDGAPEHPEIEIGTEDRYQRVSDGSFSPSFDSGGETLAFSSTASNLVFGDGNTPANGLGEVDGADVFLVPRVIFSTEPTPQTISPPPANPAIEARWQLVVTASSLRSGAVRLRVSVPGAGTLAAQAAGMLPARAGRSHRKVRRQVAKATVGVPGGASTVNLRLGLQGRYRGLAYRSGGLAGKVTVTFAAKGHPTQRSTLTVRFLHRAAARARSGGRR